MGFAFHVEHAPPHPQGHEAGALPHESAGRPSTSEHHPSGEHRPPAPSQSPADREGDLLALSSGAAAPSAAWISANQQSRRQTHSQASVSFDVAAEGSVAGSVASARSRDDAVAGGGVFSR